VYENAPKWSISTENIQPVLKPNPPQRLHNALSWVKSWLHVLMKCWLHAWQCWSDNTDTEVVNATQSPWNVCIQHFIIIIIIIIIICEFLVRLLQSEHRCITKHLCWCCIRPIYLSFMVSYFVFVYFVFDIVRLSVPVQSIAWKDSSQKWTIMCHVWC